MDGSLRLIVDSPRFSVGCFRLTGTNSGYWEQTYTTRKHRYITWKQFSELGKHLRSGGEHLRNGVSLLRSGGKILRSGGIILRNGGKTFRNGGKTFRNGGKILRRGVVCFLNAGNPFRDIYTLALLRRGYSSDSYSPRIKTAKHGIKKGYTTKVQP